MGRHCTEAAFSAELATGSDNAVQVLGLRAVEGQPLVLPEGQSLIIRPKNAGKSLDGNIEEVVIPSCFDEASRVAGARAGAELAKLGSAVFGLITHAINVTGTIKLVITGLSFLLKALKSDPGRTLKIPAPTHFISKAWVVQNKHLA
ncbi:hypothetical protein [Dyadobacter psychrotolerans]|uniref:Uncharacterized protein n=1 Tax=Dyadobacter psychrotolerans TaxID=2541721 RepID=A0A4R5DRA7_9BACT|nr:hypothetical protein [Dyadobacter psychrotolerans]TDE14824.1 hypothetical protein E0F88_16720 [Dyadobacter psychrotolerans]